MAASSVDESATFWSSVVLTPYYARREVIRSYQPALMGVYANDVRDCTRSETADDESDRAPLGERLQGLASELDVDSVDDVRDLRERL